MPDAHPLDGAAAVPAAASAGEASVPGGDASIPDVLRSAPTTPVLALLALFAAAVLGAGHALTPGHGKTLMAAYLVGTRGTPRHAVGLGLPVSVSHTLGILALAAVVLAAETRLPPDLVVRSAPLVAAVSILVIGGWMLFTEARRAIAARARSHRQAARPRGRACARRTITHATTTRTPTRTRPRRTRSGAHAHDAIAVARRPASSTRTAASATPTCPPAGSTITWRSLFVLGLAGGLVPSTNALLILLTTIAAGRPGVGRGPRRGVRARDGRGDGGRRARVRVRPGLDRARRRAVRVGRAARLVPPGAAVLVLGLGVVLTSQALRSRRWADRESRVDGSARAHLSIRTVMPVAELLAGLGRHRGQVNMPPHVRPVHAALGRRRCRRPRP